MYNCSSLDERNEWLEALNSAIEDVMNKKATFNNTEVVVSPAKMKEEETVGDSAPLWIPDQRVTMCQICNMEFTLVNRRHHCRACGKVVCSQCSGNKAPLKYRQFESARVCDSCYDAVERREYRGRPLSLYLLNCNTRVMSDQVELDLFSAGYCRPPYCRTMYYYVLYQNVSSRVRPCRSQ